MKKKGVSLNKTNAIFFRVLVFFPGAQSACLGRLLGVVGPGTHSEGQEKNTKTRKKNCANLV